MIVSSCDAVRSWWRSTQISFTPIAEKIWVVMTFAFSTAQCISGIFSRYTFTTLCVAGLADPNCSLAANRRPIRMLAIGVASRILLNC